MSEEYHQKQITSMVVLPNGYLASGSEDGSIIIMDSINAKFIKKL